MTRDIIRKLTAELDAGIATEVQVVYLLAGIRKLIERDGAKDKYPSLQFHCDWALHASMDRAAAKAMLKHFDAAHGELRKGNVELHDLPRSLQIEIRRISKMESFEEELDEFLSSYGLPQLEQRRHDGWAHFLHLYAKVIEDIPLVVAAPKSPKKGPPGATPQHISCVTVNFELGRETIKFEGFEDMPYKVIWTMQDKNGQSGSIFVINTYQIKAPSA